MLKFKSVKYYKVKENQTLRQIAEAFCVSERLLAKANGLQAPPHVGQILRIPSECGNAYTVGEGDTQALLSGSEENFVRKNGGAQLYIGQRVIL